MKVHETEVEINTGIQRIGIFPPLEQHFCVEIKMNSANSLRKSKLARKGEQMHIKDILEGNLRVLKADQIFRKTEKLSSLFLKWHPKEKF